MEQDNKLNRLRNIKMNSLKKVVLIGIVILILVIGISLLGRSSSNSSGGSKAQVSSTSSKNVPTVEINKSFEFSAINAKKEKVNIKFNLATAERKNEVKVKGEARQVTGTKDYLLLRIELENTNPERLAFATADYIRLQGDGDKLFAPDFHNGNVIIDPLSVKRDLVAYVVDKEDKNFTILVGELEGEKQKIEINF